MNPDLTAALHRSERNLGRTPFRAEEPLSFNDCISEGRDMFMDDGEIQNYENRYERTTIDAWFL